MKKLAIIGGGAMGGAIARGLVERGKFPPAQILVCDIHPDRLKRLRQETRVKISLQNEEAPAFGNAILLAVKPAMIGPVLWQMKPWLTPKHLVISIAAGVPLNKIEKILPRVPVVRVMPNNPSLIGEGMAAVCGGRRATTRQVEEVVSIFQVLGKVRILPERFFDAVTALSGSGPAFVYEFIKGLVAGGVVAGLSKEVARELALQTVRGSILTVLRTGKELDELIQMVASPRGTTEAGLKVSVRRKLVPLIQDMIRAAAGRARQLREEASRP